MNSQTFEVEVKDGILVIPPEIKDYLSQCQGNPKVSITITPSSDNSDNFQVILSPKPITWEDFFEKTPLPSEDFMEHRIDLSPQTREELF